jgi:hypothetical protein
VRGRRLRRHVSGPSRARVPVRARETVADKSLPRASVSTAIDIQRRKFTILSPNVGKLPSTTALVGGFEWQEM